MELVIQPPAQPWWRYPPLRNVLLAVLVAAAGWAMVDPASSQAVRSLPWRVALVIASYRWAYRSIDALCLEQRLSGGLLVLIAVVGLGLVGAWIEAAVVGTLYGGADGLVSYQFERVHQAAERLRRLAPGKAVLKHKRRQKTVPIDRLRVGDHFYVGRGQVVAADGVVVDGASSVFQPFAIGEAVVVDKAAGDSVLAGSINGPGVLTVEARETPKSAALARTIDLLENVQSSQADERTRIEAAAKWICLGVLLVAVPLYVLARVGNLPSVWAERAAALLVAAVPDAVMVARPILATAMIVSAVRGAAEGALAGCRLGGLAEVVTQRARRLADPVARKSFVVSAALILLVVFDVVGVLGAALVQAAVLAWIVVTGWRAGLASALDTNDGRDGRDVVDHGEQQVVSER